MNRLLFAAARGARIQWCFPSSRKWFNTGSVSIHPDKRERIHPEDKHLQYGPISSALRDRALGKGIKEFALLQDVNIYSDGNTMLMSDLEYSLFGLILAEALADEGL